MPTFTPPTPTAGRRPRFELDSVILWSTENLLFVSNRSQARITVAQNTTMAALSLLALPTAGEAVRVDAGYARGREYSGLPSGLKQCLVLVRARCGPTTTPRDGRGAQAGAETHAGGGTLEGGEPFFGRARCGASCLAPDWDEEEARNPKVRRSPNAVRLPSAVRNLNGARKNDCPWS